MGLVRIFLPVLALAVGIIAIACSDPNELPRDPTAELESTLPPTRLTAAFAPVLREVDGCLRVGPSDETSSLLLWPPGQHVLSREGDTLTIVDTYPGREETATWRIGERVSFGGGEVFSLDVPHEPLPEHCSDGPYLLVGDVDNPDNIQRQFR